jgi:hypothetical protein
MVFEFFGMVIKILLSGDFAPSPQDWMPYRELAFKEAPYSFLSC